MDGLNLSMSVVNIILSCLVLYFLLQDRLLKPSQQRPISHVSPRRRGTRLKPVINDDQKEYAAEQERLKTGTPVL